MRDPTMRGNSDYRLAPLEDLEGYRVAEGDPDPRGWIVCAADGRRVGRVDSLIADTGSMKVRYLDVALDKDTMNLSEDRHVLVPIGGARLNDGDDVVDLATLPSSRLAQLPSYQHDPISRDDELQLMSRFDDRYSPAPYADFYSHQNFSDQRFFGNRRRGREGAAYLIRSLDRRGRARARTPKRKSTDDE